MTDARRPWSLDPGRTPVERFLGREFDAGGPLALLGLTRENSGPDQVASALALQLQCVSEHPHATSHEADEVRLALHSAAAQLMDPRTREAILAAAPSPRANPRLRRSVSPLTVAKARAEIRRTLGRFGGLNEKSVRMLALVADRYGISNDQLADVVRASIREPGRELRRARAAPGPVSGPPRPARAPSPARLAGAPAPDEIDPAVRVLRLVLVLGGVGIAAVLVAIIAIWLIVRGMTPGGTAAPPSPPPVITQRNGDVRTPPTPANPSADSKAPTTGAPDAVAERRRLAHAVELLAADPSAALNEFRGAGDALSRVWPDLSPDQLAAAQDSIVEFLYRSEAHPEVGESAVRSICSGSQALRGSPVPIDAARVLPAIWSIGQLTRLARERELPAQLRTIVDSELAGALSGVGAGGPASFSGGATAAIMALPRLMVRAASPQAAGAVSPEAAFEQWLLAARAVSGSDERAADRLILAGIEIVLAEGPEPEPGGAVGGVVRLLTTAASWRADSESRPRLIRWFDAHSISSADLNAVTTALASSSGASGVDPTMVLPAGAALPQRQELRDRYLTTWSLKDQGTQDALVADWAKLGRDLTSRPSAGTPVEQLARAVVLARLNLAASQLNAGLSTEPGDIIRAIDAPVAAIMSTAGSAALFTSLDDGASDGSWAVRYLGAEKNIPQRAALLSELGQLSGPLGRTDAEVLATEAFRGAPAQIRRSAADLVVKFAGGPAVVNAALEQVPFLARSQDNAELLRKISLGHIPALRDPDWRIGVRRALVERLLQLLASRGEDRAVDDLADLLADTYAQRESIGAADQAGTPSGKYTADSAARAVRTSWERWAAALTPTGREPLSLDEIRRRHTGRAELAEGLVQSFAAEQVTAAELMAYVVTNERPHAAADAKAVLDRLAASRRSAEHVFGQILACERAITELFMIRMEVPQS